MHYIRLCLAAAFLLGASVTVSAQAAAQGSKTTLIGADFLKACTRADMDWINFCNGYVQAVVDGVVGRGDFCLPAGTTRAKIVDTVVEQLMASPELQKLNGASAVSSALRKAHPC